MLNSAYQFSSIAATELEYGLNIEKRTIFLNGEIEAGDGLFFTQKMELLNRFSINCVEENNPITIIINSGGGDVYAMFAIIDAIRGSKSLVHTVGTGQIMSAASLIIAAGTGKRIVTPNTSLMIHEMSTGLAGNTSLIRANSKHIDQLQDRFVRLYEEFTGKASSFWKRKMVNELYLSAEEALQYGLIDEITYDFRGALTPPEKEEEEIPDEA